ncbi:hypothetical protein LTR94_028542, partial [Friedmanniomyces endolithicus]
VRGGQRQGADGPVDGQSHPVVRGQHGGPGFDCIPDGQSGRQQLARYQADRDRVGAAAGDGHDRHHQRGDHCTGAFDRGRSGTSRLSGVRCQVRRRALRGRRQRAGRPARRVQRRRRRRGHAQRERFLHRRFRCGRHGQLLSGREDGRGAAAHVQVRPSHQPPRDRVEAQRSAAAGDDKPGLSGGREPARLSCRRTWAEQRERIGIGTRRRAPPGATARRWGASEGRRQGQHVAAAGGAGCATRQLADGGKRGGRIDIDPPRLVRSSSRVDEWAEGRQGHLHPHRGRRLQGDDGAGA